MAKCFSGPPRVPSMPLLANIWSGPALPPPVGPPRLTDVPCQLTLGERVPFVIEAGVSVVIYMLFPKGTDLRGVPQAGLDLVECPAGSGRYYHLIGFDDVAKGFANEYRQAWLEQVAPWPVPTP